MQIASTRDVSCEFFLFLLELDKLEEIRIRVCVINAAARFSRYGFSFRTRPWTSKGAFGGDLVACDFGDGVRI